MTDYRFPSPGVDARFPGGGVDNYFDNGGRFVGGKDLRFEAPGLGGGVIGPADAILPAPSFGSTNLLAWSNVAKTWRDWNGVDQASVYYDTVAFDTVSAVEDLSGNGYGVRRGDKALQPLKGASGGAVTDIAGHSLLMERLSLVNGLGKLSGWMRVKPRSDLAVTGSKRCLICISEAPSTATPPGNGTGVERFALYLQGGTTGRRLYAVMSAADGAQKSTTITSGPQLANDAFSTVGFEMDWAGAQATISLYLNSTSGPYTESWTPAETAPWAFNTADSAVISIGDNGQNNSPSLCEIAGWVFKSNIDATERGQMKAEMDGAA